MRSLLLLSLLLAVLGWAVWSYGPRAERGHVARSPQPASMSATPGGGDSFYIAEEESVGGSWELLVIGICFVSVCIATAAAIVWAKDRFGGA